MESSIVIKNSSENSKNRTRFRHKTFSLVVFLIITLVTMLLASRLSETHETLKSSSHHLLIKKACTTTLYPSVCFTTLSSLPPSMNASNLHHFLDISINQTMDIVARTQLNIVGVLSTRKDLNSQEKNALNDCLEMMGQTLYELGRGMNNLHDFPATSEYLPILYGNLKTLLSAAMTNENTCIDGFSYLEQGVDSENQRPLLKDHFEHILTPISRMISNCLAIIKNLETINREENQNLNNGGDMVITKMPPRHKFPAWMGFIDRRHLIESVAKLKPDMIVANDGSGDYRWIGEAVKMAPNNSMRRFVIKIKAGVYNESVIIPREKVNIMLVGDGSNSTVISGNKSFADGYSTFTSATLTVIGDKFLARDLSVINTAGPEKHQAVALRVTSDSAFYRCNFSSYQDTLYAHSLRQFYRNCTIQGTIDFIFGNAAAIFQNCRIFVRKPIPGQRNMITAQGREDPNQNTGTLLQNCIIMAAPDFTMAERKNFSTFLGRPWRNYSRTIVMKSYLGDLIDLQGWSKWNNYSTTDTVEYVEYKNFGPGSNTKGRVSWIGYKQNCTEDIARKITAGAFLHGGADWIESTGFPFSQRSMG